MAAVAVDGWVGRRGCAALAARNDASGGVCRAWSDELGGMAAEATSKGVAEEFCVDGPGSVGCGSGGCPASPTGRGGGMRGVSCGASAWRFPWAASLRRCGCRWGVPLGAMAKCVPSSAWSWCRGSNRTSTRWRGAGAVCGARKICKPHSTSTCRASTVGATLQKSRAVGMDAARTKAGGALAGAACMGPGGSEGGAEAIILRICVGLGEHGFAHLEHSANAQARRTINAAVATQSDFGPCRRFGLSRGVRRRGWRVLG
ncbi:hypothetical protein THIARS_70471 [Thiomonas delicata]|uniref:Uncharacterized protein n=1 Tax=Thiomonas delicata TaxID=364030 RepID=A0A238D6K4_THIDL|nr:hypothetical protein THIARS_70471 [Thiomonas delicata]